MVQARAALDRNRRERLSLDPGIGTTCTACTTWKAWEEFRPQQRHLNARRPTCRDCFQIREVCRDFGITPEEWRSLLESQGGVCALCEERSDCEKTGRRLCIDHDHSCCGPKGGCRNCIRGLLCTACNMAVGGVERVARLREACGFYLDRRPLAADLIAKPLCL